MKFGILTFHNVPNYGAALQAYSLCKAMVKLGADCEIIDYRCENIILRELTFEKSKNLIKTVLKYVLVWTKIKKRIKGFNRFMADSQVVSEISYNRETIAKSNNVYEAFITGSDMVWNLNVTNNDRTFFLDFTEKNKYRFSYASSNGENAIWNDPDIFPLLKNYDYISVREESLKKEIENNGLNCCLVSDPTMLIEREYWSALADKIKNVYKKYKYVLVYYPYDEILTAAKKYAAENGFKLFVIGTFKKPFCGYSVLTVHDPVSWLNAFKYADTIFTDSYHGVLFSMYLNKNFWTNNNGKRISSILNTVGINDRYIKCGVNSKKINYNNVNQKLDEFKNRSLEYLKKVIDCAEGEN